MNSFTGKHNDGKLSPEEYREAMKYSKFIRSKICHDLTSGPEEPYHGDNIEVYLGDTEKEE